MSVNRDDQHTLRLELSCYWKGFNRRVAFEEAGALSLSLLVEVLLLRFNFFEVLHGTG